MQLPTVVSSAVDGDGLAMQGYGAGIGHEPGKRFLGGRLEELFEMIGKPPIIVIQNTEILASDSVQASPQACASISADACDGLEALNPRKVTGLERRQVNFLMLDENYFEAAISLLADRANRSFQVSKCLLYGTDNHR